MAAVDRGYAWVVMVASCILQLFGFGSSIGGVGVMLISFSKAFPDADRTEISWIGSLRAFQLLTSPMAVLLIKRFGCRTVTIVGAIISGAGIAVSSVSTQVWHAYLTYGILGGIGVGLTYTASTTVLGEYFDKKKNIAFPVSCLGGSLGLLIFPYLLRVMLDNTGHKTTLYITAALKIVEIACGVVFKPNKLDSTEEIKDSELRDKPLQPSVGAAATKFVYTLDLTGHSNANYVSDPESPKLAGENRAQVQAEDQYAHDDVTRLPADRRHESKEDVNAVSVIEKRVEDLSTENSGHNGVIAADVETAAVEVSRGNAAVRMLRLLRDWQCWCLVIHAFCWGLTDISTEELAPISVQSRGVSDSDASLGLTLFGAGTLFSSLIMLALGARKYDRFGLYLPTSGVLGVASILLSVWNMATAYLVICSVYGFVFGILISLFLSVVSDFKSPAMYADLFGLYVLFNGVGGLVGPVAMGALQTSVSDQASWYLCGVIGLLGTAVLIPPYVVRRKPKCL